MTSTEPIHIQKSSVPHLEEQRWDKTFLGNYISSAEARKQICLFPRSVFVTLLFGLLFGLLLGCTQASSFQPAANRAADDSPADTALIITISGSTAALPMLQELTAEFRRQEPDTIFDILGGGSHLGETAVGVGRAELAISTLLAAPDAEPPIVSSPTISKTEVSDIGSPKAELIRAPIALSGLALIVHINNPVADLTLDQIQMIYSGRALQWSNVLGDQAADSPAGEWQQKEILLISREELSGARMLFDERVMAGERLSLTSIIVPTTAAVVESVASNERAIGYVDRAFIAHLLPNAPVDLQEGAAVGASSIRVLAIDGLLPEDSAISSQQYPLIYPLYIIHRIKQQPFERDLIGEQVDKFIQLISSEAGQQIVGRYHTLIGP